MACAYDLTFLRVMRERARAITVEKERMLGLEQQLSRVKSDDPQARDAIELLADHVGSARAIVGAGTASFNRDLQIYLIGHDVDFRRLIAQGKPTFEYFQRERARLFG